MRINGPGESAWHRFDFDGTTGRARWTATDVGIHTVRIGDADSAFGPADRYTVGFSVERPAGRPSTRAVLEQDLLDRVAPWSCSTWRAKQDPKPFADGALAAIQCAGQVPGVDRVTLFTFDDTRSLEAHLVKRIDAAGSVGASDLPCDRSRPDPVEWQHGRLACWIAPQGSVAQVHWTDERTKLYGILEAAQGDLEALYGHWAERPPGGPSES